MGVKQIALHGRALAPRHFSGASKKSKWLIIKSIGSLHLNLWHGPGAHVDKVHIWHNMAVYGHIQTHLEKTKLNLVVTKDLVKLNLVEEALGVHTEGFLW